MLVTAAERRRGKLENEEEAEDAAMMGTPLRRKAPAYEMAEAELHKERLQALAEKRKRQAEIEDKRRQLDELVLQLQHFKSKAMRERWLLQGTPAMPQEEDEGRRKQVEQDELHVKTLEDAIHRLESEICLLENEESQISAKEQVLRERLRETERSIEDLQKSLQNQDGDAVNYNCSQIPDLPELNSQTPVSASGDQQPPRKSGGEKARSVLLTPENGLYPIATARSAHPLKSPVHSEDDSELKRERSLKTVSFFDSVSVISSGESSMELEVQTETQQSYESSGQNRVRHGGEGLDSEVAKEILYLDQVLEDNCCDPRAEITSNGTRSPDIKSVRVHGTGPSVNTCDPSPLHNHDIVLEGKKQTTFVDDNFNTKPNGHAMDCTRTPESPRTAIKKEARFELRPFHEEKKPSKLFDPPTEKEVRVKKVRPSEEIAELEKERLELIRGQAVKKNPGIAAKWWNPPQEKTLEEELEPEQLESLRRYVERKQMRTEANRIPQAAPRQTTSFIQTEIENREDVVMEEIDFSAARKQFLQIEHSKQPTAPKRNVAPQLYSAKPFVRTPEVTHVERPCSSVIVANQEGVTSYDGSEITTVKAEKIYCFSGESATPPKDGSAQNELKYDEFTCARAVMTIVKDEDSYLCQRSLNSSYHTEEIDSGLDDLSLRSQDTTVLETLSNDFSMDNISDSGASNETMSAYLENSLGEYSFPSTPMATTPINGKHESGIKSPDEQRGSYQAYGLTEEELEYHAGILVQNAIQQAIAQQNDKWEPLQATQHSSPILERHVESTEPQPQPLVERPAVTPPPKVPSPLEEEKTIAPQITVVQAAPITPVNTYKPPSPSPPPSEKPEFSYFSKYSEAAELRSTAAVTRAKETEVTSGPFKLRSRKQRTLSMIEEEIRAAQEREEELKRQRHAQTLHLPRTQKLKTSTQPNKLVLAGKTAPGKIEKVRQVPPASPCSSDGALPSPLSDLGSDDSGGQRPKNFMQTLMEDYETHKVKRREKTDDNSYVRSVTTEVLEATRVTRRKSNMALRWEAGIYTNQEEAEEEEEEEEE